ncbi:MAG: hypothetical protein ACXV5Q_00080 [Frankiaceae bacterium]
MAGGLVLAACTPAVRRTGPPPPGHWVRFRHLAGVVDLAGPRGDGSFTVAAGGRLYTLTRAGVLRPFARGQGGYSTPLGPEPYIALAGRGAVAGAGCSFPSGMIFALQPGRHPGIIAVTPDGRASRFTSLPATVTPDGIAFDATGRFGHRLLVTARHHAATMVLAIDCAGAVRTVTSRAPAMEGGIAVAPASFGRFGGDLIAPSERSGRVFAIRPDGAVTTLAVSGLPHGGDIGVESAGFLPAGFGPGDAAYLADRYSQGNPHPGSNSLLRLPGSQLLEAGARPGDLLVATEAGARTIVVRCANTCTVRHIAAGPALTHAEGHIAFVSQRRGRG